MSILSERIIDVDGVYFTILHKDDGLYNKKYFCYYWKVPIWICEKYSEFMKTLNITDEEFFDCWSHYEIDSFIQDILCDKKALGNVAVTGERFEGRVYIGWDTGHAHNYDSNTTEDCDLLFDEMSSLSENLYILGE